MRLVLPSLYSSSPRSSVDHYRSEIVTLSDQFIHFSHDFLVNSDAELLFRHSYDKLRTACTKCTALSIH